MLPNRAKHHIIQIVVILTNTYVLELKDCVQISPLTLSEFRFSDVSRGYRKTTRGCNGLIKLISFYSSWNSSWLLWQLLLQRMKIFSRNWSRRAKGCDLKMGWRRSSVCILNFEHEIACPAAWLRSGYKRIVLLWLTL